MLNLVNATDSATDNATDSTKPNLTEVDLPNCPVCGYSKELSISVSYKEDTNFRYGEGKYYGTIRCPNCGCCVNVGFTYSHNKCIQQLQDYWRDMCSKSINIPTDTDGDSNFDRLRELINYYMEEMDTQKKIAACLAEKHADIINNILKWSGIRYKPTTVSNLLYEARKNVM